MGAPGEPAFQNGWNNVCGPFATMAYFKDLEGVVHLRGSITAASRRPRSAPGGLPALRHRGLRGARQRRRPVRGQRRDREQRHGGDQLRHAAVRISTASVSAPRPEIRTVRPGPASRGGAWAHYPPAPMFSKVLVANRGEIAIRVMRTLEELGIASVAVYSEPDRDALHVAARRRGLPARPRRRPPRATWRSSKILEVARSRAPRRSTPATASWPRTRPSRARCEEAGIVFIGPPANAIDAMGSKTRARELMARPACRSCPAPPSPWTTSTTPRKLIDETIGYPVAIKAAGGGGGKGFRVARAEDRARERVRGRRARGREVLRRRDRLHRALPARPAPRRGAGPGRLRTATWCTSASATARCSAATRS